MSDDERGQVERWVYIGRRVLAKGGLGHYFLEPTGQARGFKKVSAHAVGATYEVHAIREGDSVSIAGSPRFVEAAQEGSEAAVWEAEDRAAYTADELRKAEARAKREGKFGELTLNDVRDLMRRRPMQATALLAQIIRYVNGAS